MKKTIKIIRGEERNIIIRLRDQNDDPIDLTGDDILVEFSKADGTVLKRRNHAFAFVVASLASDTLTSEAHGLVDNDEVQLSTSGTLPAGLATSTDYYVQVVDADTIKLLDAPNGNIIDITDNGTGDHTLLDASVTFPENALLGKINVHLTEEATAALKVEDQQTIEVQYTIADVTRIVQLEKAIDVVDQVY